MAVEVSDLVLSLVSVIVATCTMLLSTSIAVFAGYSLARLQYPGKALIDKTILFVYIIPPVLPRATIFAHSCARGFHGTSRTSPMWSWRHRSNGGGSLKQC